MDTQYNLKDIDGIADVTEGRLGSVGVHSVDDLARSDPDVLHGRLRGAMRVSAKQVREWVNSARGISGFSPAEPLAGDESAPGPDAAAIDSDDGEDQQRGVRRESFLLALVVEEGGRVTRTAVTDLRSKQERAWAKWPPSAVASFIERSVGLYSRPSAEPSVTSGSEVPGAGRGAASAPSVDPDVVITQYAIAQSAREVAVSISLHESTQALDRLVATARPVGESGAKAVRCPVTWARDGSVSVSVPAFGDHKGVYELQLLGWSGRDAA